MSEPLRKTFLLGAKVLVSARGGWRRYAPGTIVAGPEPIQTVQGEDYFWWVEFLTPERDLDDDGAYSKAQILSRYIEDAT
jgi:hypothetical protein